jgi:hypothetical protein
MYAGEGAPPEPACRAGTICCEVEDQCYDPDTEAELCLRPYCE